MLIDASLPLFPPDWMAASSTVVVVVEGIEMCNIFAREFTSSASGKQFAVGAFVKYNIRMVNSYWYKYACCRYRGGGLRRTYGVRAIGLR